MRVSTRGTELHRHGTFNSSDAMRIPHHKPRAGFPTTTTIKTRINGWCKMASQKHTVCVPVMKSGLTMYLSTNSATIQQDIPDWVKGSGAGGGALIDGLLESLAHPPRSIALSQCGGFVSICIAPQVKNQIHARNITDASSHRPGHQRRCHHRCRHTAWYRGPATHRRA